MHYHSNALFANVLAVCIDFHFPLLGLKSLIDAKIKQRQDIQTLYSSLSKGLKKDRPSLEDAYDKDIKVSLYYWKISLTYSHS